MIKELKKEHYQAAMDLIKKTYIELEAKYDTKEGQAYFLNEYVKEEAFLEHTFFGYFEKNRMIGVVSINSIGHIEYLFVSHKHVRKGIGSSLLDYAIGVLKEQNIQKVSLSSSRYGYDFYLHYGFSPISSAKSIMGMNYTPMVLML